MSQPNPAANAIHAFPPGFLWGTATAAHQVEGNNYNSWSAWEQGGGGRIHADAVSGPACDWWGGRWREDFERARGMNNNALRFSVEWSRIEPEPGRWEEPALAYYREWADWLAQHNMQPVITLHHFSNPIWLEERGGWLSEDTPRLFARYAGKVAAALGDKVTLWCTINEPMVYSAQSYLLGLWPPGHSSLSEALHVAANLVRGHAAAYHAIKQVQPGAQVGFAKHQITYRAGEPGWLNAPARQLSHWMFNELFLGPFRRGRMRTGLGTAAIPEARGALDWIGLQYYHQYTVRFSPQDADVLAFQMRARPEMPRGPQPGWGELAPRNLLAHAAHLWKRTRRPVYVTEAGVPDAGDTVRPGYLAESVRSAWDIANMNYPIQGFFYWSLVDNFEWAEGYDPRFRFGLYAVDFNTQARTERDSARLYRAICGANALDAQMVARYAPAALDDLFPSPHRQESKIQ